MQQIETVSALPNVGPYIYDVSISGFTRSSIYIYDISGLRVNEGVGAMLRWAGQVLPRRERRGV